MRRHLPLSSFIVICLLILTSGVVQAEASEITVSAAISLKNAFEEIGRLYETKHPSVKVQYNFGASGDLERQIEGGAPVDVFASAAKKDMDTLDGDKLLLPGTRRNFAGNNIVLIVPSGSKTALSSFEGLLDKKIGKIAAGNPKTVPAGRYGEEVLLYHKLLPAVKDRIVFAENVRQVLDYVARGEVDAGIVYSTDAMSRARETSVVATAPGASHRPVIYPIAAVKGSKNKSAATDFIAMVLSPEGQKILEKYGFKKP